MKITLGEYQDVSLGEEGHPDRGDMVILTVYGANAAVVRGDGVKMRPFSDETGYENMPRAYFHLKPFGMRDADPFPDDEYRKEAFHARKFDFYVKYTKTEDDDDKTEVEREATVTIVAFCDDPIAWNAEVTVEGVGIDLGKIERINWDIGESSLRDLFGTAGNRPQCSAEDDAS